MAVSAIAIIIITTYRARNGTFSSLLALVMYAIGSGVLILFLTMASRNEDHSSKFPTNGTILAIIPTYNEIPETLNACIESLLTQTRYIDHIAVVDDGSITPPTPHTDPRIT
jgi:hyaluronan synthase